MTSQATTPRFDVRDVNRILGRVSVTPRRKKRTLKTYQPTVTKEEVRKSLQRLYPFREARRRRKILRAYDRAARGLNEAKRVTERFVRTLLTQSFDFTELYVTEDQRVDVTAVMQQQLAEFYAVSFTDPPSIKTLELLAADTPTIAKELGAHLEFCRNQFVDELFSLFERMQGRHVLGQIRYAGERCDICEFSYFRSKAVQDLDRPIEVKEVRVISSNTSPVYLKRNGVYRTRKTVTEFAETAYATIRHVRAKQVLSDVRTVPLTDWQLPFPERLLPVKGAIPEFLRPFAFVVEGTLERALFVEADVAESSFTYRRIEEKEEEFRHDDPCLLIGPVVVAAWCPDEQPKSNLGIRLLADLHHRLAAREGGKR